MAYSATFRKNWSTFIINSPNFLSLFSNYFLDFFIFLIYMVLQFLDFPDSLFVLLSINESFPKEAKEMELSNSWAFKELKLHEMPSTSRVDSMPCLPSPKVSLIHVIFNPNGVFVVACFNRVRYGKVPTCTTIFKLGLKWLLERSIS